MACSIGTFNTITLSDDGVVHAFGKNDVGQLGFAHNKDVSLPTPIPNLPKIKMIACGGCNFTVCVDHEGFIWSFGENNWGQLGTGNTTKFNVPQKIQDIPPVLSVACGLGHTFIITDKLDLWSCGNNESGQLCLGNKEFEFQSKFQQTLFSNISKVSLGASYSLFQDNNGEIYSCGDNSKGELALGHINSPQITPTKIPNLPTNIVQFICGLQHSLFLDSEGKVFSTGYNYFGQLGLSHNINQYEINQIPNIPPIHIISCGSDSSYLIDLDGNLWSFGCNIELKEMFL